MKIKNYFKVIVIILLFSMLSICLFACKNTTEETKNNTSVEENVNGTSTQTKEHNELYFTCEMDYNKYMVYEDAIIMRNKENFQTFLENNLIAMSTEDKKLYIEEKLTKYDESFFDNNILILLDLRCRYPSYTLINNLYVNDNLIYAVGNGTRKTGTIMAVVKDWDLLYFVSVDKNELKDWDLDKIGVAGLYKYDEYEELFSTN